MDANMAVSDSLFEKLIPAAIEMRYFLNYFLYLSSIFSDHFAFTVFQIE